VFPTPYIKSGILLPTAHDELDLYLLAIIHHISTQLRYVADLVAGAKLLPLSAQLDLHHYFARVIVRKQLLDDIAKTHVTGDRSANRLGRVIRPNMNAQTRKIWRQNEHIIAAQLVRRASGHANLNALETRC
jgi:hypothetical protein